MSKTPRTDAELRKPENNTGILIHLAHFARQLELENAHLQKTIEELKRTLSKCMYALQDDAELLKDKERLAIRLYNSGYKAGHHDTVEAGYVDIHWFDMDNYHEEEALEIMKDFFDENQPKQ